VIPIFLLVLVFEARIFRSSIFAARFLAPNRSSWSWRCWSFRPSVLEETSSDALQAVAFVLNIVIWVGFAAELAFVLSVASKPLRTLRAH
jgi:hypothetical protein